MRNKWIKRIFPLLAILLITPFSIAYASNNDRQDIVHAEVSEPSATLSATPLEETLVSISVDEAEAEATDVTVTLGPIQRLKPSQPIKNASANYEVQEVRDQYFARVSPDHIIVTTGNPALLAKLYTKFHYFEYYYWWGGTQTTVSAVESWQIVRAG